jgi:AraC-like DNA-binding protein
MAGFASTILSDPEEDGQHRVGVLVHAPALLRDLEANPNAVLAQAGVAPEALDDPDNHIPFPLHGRLFTECIAATGREEFGVLLGLRSSTQNLGTIGALMRTAPTLREAILDLCSNQRRYLRGAVTFLLVRDGMAFWAYSVYRPRMPSRENLCDGAIAAGCRFLQELVGIVPEEVLLSRPQPGDPAAFRRAYGVPVRFNAEFHAAMFPAKCLDLRVPTADPDRRHALRIAVANYWAVSQPSIAEQVTRILYARLAASEVSQELVARDLAMHPRTLNRLLQAEGTSFRTLRNEARVGVACQLLASTRLPVTEVGLALGYAETSAFTHAFRRVTRMTPSGWREEIWTRQEAA